LRARAAADAAILARRNHPAWQWRIAGDNLVVTLPGRYRVLSWAVHKGGFGRARFIVNHQVRIGDRQATAKPRPHLRAVLKTLAIAPADAVAMMTGAAVSRAAYAAVSRGDLCVGAWCTAGCSNALRIGDPASFADPGPGTINLAVAINRCLSRTAMAEALAMATEGRTAAVQNAGVLSVRSGHPATGTGTDCVVVASPAEGKPDSYCGKHTLLGELIGQAVLRCCATALRRAKTTVR
jgi:adenosylcobinamide amidohydrolase